jgi:hypothetical protein
LIDSVIHASEVFGTPNTVLKTTLVMERPNLQPIPLNEHVVDLDVGVKQVVIGD